MMFLAAHELQLCDLHFQVSSSIICHVVNLSTNCERPTVIPSWVTMASIWLARPL